jgi:hypothetical protein
VYVNREIQKQITHIHKEQQAEKKRQKEKEKLHHHNKQHGQ